MIIWRGWGILVVLIVGLFELIGYTLIVEPLGLDTKSTSADIIGYLLFLPAAVVIWFVGKYLNGKSKRVVIDKETGQEITLPVAHSLFFVRMEYWAIIFAALSIILCIASFFQ